MSVLLICTILGQRGQENGFLFSSAVYRLTRLSSELARPFSDDVELTDSYFGSSSANFTGFSIHWQSEFGLVLGMSTLMYG